MKKRKRNRKLGFDYASEAIYFLTSCVKDRICCLGKIKNGEIILNEYGKIIDGQVTRLEKQYPYFQIHNYVVMPNHVHILCEVVQIVVGVRSQLDHTATCPVPAA